MSVRLIGHYCLGVGSAEVLVRKLADGSVEGPNGIVYRRTATRLKRRTSNALVAGGAPVLTSVYPDGLEWHDGGTDATDAWMTIKPRLVEGRRSPVREQQWVGHLCQSDSGAFLLLFEGQH